MGRNKTISAEEQVALAKDYYLNVCFGSIDKFKFYELAQYISQKTGIDIKEHSVRRCKEVRDYLDTLKSQDEVSIIATDINTYRALDVDDFLAQHNSIQSLRVALMQRDELYYSIVKKAAKATSEYSTTKELCIALENQCATLLNEKSVLEAEVVTLNEDLRSLRRTIVKMRTILEENVNQNIANQLLVEAGVLKIDEADCILSDKALPSVISVTDNIPEQLQKYENRIIQGLFEKI